jgi:cytoskeleton protein RodZ
VVSFILLVVLGMALFTVALIIQPDDRAERSRPELGPAAPPPPDSAGEPATSTPPVAAPLPPAAPPPPAVAASPPAPVLVPGLETLAGSVSSPYRLIARVSDPSWIRVRTEDGRTSEETVPAGEVREWVSDRPFVVTIGNAGGVALELNGHALPPLGARGTVVPRLVLPPEPR